MANKKVVLVDSTKNDGFEEFYTVQREILEKNGIDFVLEDCKNEDDVIAKCKDADALLVVSLQITPKAIEALDNCKVMVRYGIGYDAIDVEAATKKGIMVCNIPDYCIEEVATHTIALMLAAIRKICFYNNQLIDGKWLVNSGYSIRRLSTMTLGLVGFGHIARQTAKYAQAFGMTIYAYDPFVTEEQMAALNVKKMDLDELCRNSDVVSVHVPLNEQTRHIINKDNIAIMKDGVILINTSRGPQVCEEDLIAAVKSGKVKAAGLDVCESEPISIPHHPLFETGNIIVTPHAAYYSEEASVDLWSKAAQTVANVLNGEIPHNIVCLLYTSRCV